MKTFEYFEDVTHALKAIFDTYRSKILYYEPVEIANKVIIVRAVLKNHKYVKYTFYDDKVTTIIDYVEF